MSEQQAGRIFQVSLKVNGERVTAQVAARQHAIDFLREELGLTGSHAGCEQGVCGACTIRVDGEIVRGCLMLAPQLDGVDLWTIEGVTDTAEIADLQAEFVARNALQCGFCTPGMLMTSAELIVSGEVPAREAIRDHLSGNYCRCTGYEAIVDAIETTARVRVESEAKAKEAAE